MQKRSAKSSVADDDEHPHYDLLTDSTQRTTIKEQNQPKPMTNTSTPSDSPDIDSCVRIGSIVSSNSHLDYIAEVYKDRDCDRPPKLHEREFGQPVFIEKVVGGIEHAIFGVIYDTQLVDPDQGRTGPRLAQDDQAQFTPGYIEERTTFAGIALLGTAVVNDDRTIMDPSHQMPRWTLEVDDTVYHCPDTIVESFHRVDGDVQLAYMDRLVDISGDLGSEVVVALIDRLRKMLPKDDPNQRVLDVVKQNVQWQAREHRGVV